ncbi:MAG: hypothetical protein IJE10_08955 [Clostridia bacterium]|nr:hypothetical protein [Clostridia bacterium]
MESKPKICCFIGHRKVKDAEKLKEKLFNIIETFIIRGTDTFLFGSKSEFNDICYNIVTALKQKHVSVRRIYIRAEYPEINDDYKSYLLEKYEDTYFPERAKNAGKAVYIERNFEMIDRANVCVFYYDEKYLPPQTKKGRYSVTEHQPASGTKTAYEYAMKKGKEIVNLLPF